MFEAVINEHIISTQFRVNNDEARILIDLDKGRLSLSHNKIIPPNCFKGSTTEYKIIPVKEME